MVHAKIHGYYFIFRGYFGPGGRHEDGKYFNCTGGITGYLDKLILGKNHVYQYPTVDSVYASGPYDPEGILGIFRTNTMIRLVYDISII